MTTSQPAKPSSSSSHKKSPRTKRSKSQGDPRDQSNRSVRSEPKSPGKNKRKHLKSKDSGRLYDSCPQGSKGSVSKEGTEKLGVPFFDNDSGHKNDKQRRHRSSSPHKLKKEHKKSKKKDKSSTRSQSPGTRKHAHSKPEGDLEIQPRRRRKPASLRDFDMTQEVENELNQMLGSMNNGKEQFDSATSSKHSTKSKKKKKERRNSQKAMPPRNEDGTQDELPPLSGDQKRSKSTKSKSERKKKKKDGEDQPRKSRRTKSDVEKHAADGEGSKKAKKKKRRSSKSPGADGKGSSRQHSKRETTDKSNATMKATNSNNEEPLKSPIPSSQSLTGNQSPGALRRTVSDHHAAMSAKSAGTNKLRRARSLFGSVLNPNAKGAETVGDGSDNDDGPIRDNSGGANGKGLLGWAKKKSFSPKSPGTFLKKKRALRGGTRKKEDDDDDQAGLLSRAEDTGAQMSLLNLVVPEPGEEENKKNTFGEDNTIEESNEFNMPHLSGNANGKTPPRNTRASMASEANTMRNSAVIDSNRPPFSQIIASDVNIDEEEDDLSDIGDPEANMVIAEGMEPEDGDPGEIVTDPDRNDVLYQVKDHPGTVGMIHVLREILVEHQDDIEYSPEVYKVIKRRLKGRKFLLKTVLNGQLAWREATKSENVRLLKDFFHEEMRQLGFGGDASIENSERRPGINGTGDADNLLQRAIAECKWAQEIAKPNGDIEMMNLGIDAEEKLISLIEISDAGGPKTELLKEELDNLGELAKQMMYVSIAPLYERLEEIELRMSEYFDQENAYLDAMGMGHPMEDDMGMGHPMEVGMEHPMEVGMEHPMDRSQDLSRDSSYRDRSMEKDGEIYEVAMNSGSYEEQTYEDSVDEFSGEDSEEEEEEIIEEEEEEFYEEEDDDESSEASGTNIKEGEVLNCETNDGDVSSVGESGIYEESESDSYESDLEDGDPSEGEYDESDYTDSEEGSEFDEDSEHSSDDDESDVSDAPKGKKKKSIFEEPNPKMKQFFDRLNHFFETRKRLEECAASKDPGGKCRKIKAKSQSGGIEKKNGGFKKEFQQRNVNNKVVRNLDDLYAAAQAAYPDFKSIVQQLVDEISGLDYKKNIILPELKSRAKAYEKAASEYSDRDLGPPESWLYDICRASIVCGTVKQVNEICKWLQSNSNVVQAKNRFAEPVFNGYRDLLYHISVPYGDGRSHICEVQVHLKAMYDLNVQTGTIKHYEYFRNSFSNQWRSQEDALSDLEKMNKYTKIEGPFMKRLLKSEDPEQLLLFAEILRIDLEEYERALEIYRRVLGLQEEAHGADNPEMAATYQNIGLVLGAMGDTDESLQNLLKALAIQESFLESDNVKVADSYVEIGHMLSKRGDYSGAYTQYQRTKMIRENKLGKEHFLVIKSIEDIGLVLQKKGDFEESEKEYRKALAIQKAVLGEGHLDVATTHSLIGKTLCLYGDFEKAMAEEQLAFDMREKTLGKNHVDTADSHTAIGVLLFHKGDYKNSRWHHNKALKTRESMLGKMDVVCATSHRYLGELLSAEGDYDGAIKTLKRAQEILEANVGMDNPATANSYLDLGHIHFRHGKHQEALSEYRRAKVVLESNLGQTHPETAAAYMCTGNALNLAGEQEEALQMHRKALVVLQSVLGTSHPRTADGYQSTGDVFMASGNPELALPEHQEALKIRKSVLRKNHPAIAESCSRIGKILLTGCDSSGDTKKRDPKGALEIYKEALAITEARCGKDHPASAAARLDVALALMEMNQMDEAEEQLTATLKVLREVEPLEKGKKPTKSFYLGFGDSAGVTGKACVSLGTVLEQKGNSEGAREMFVEGHERLSKTLGGDHPDTVKIESKLLEFVKS